MRGGTDGGAGVDRASDVTSDLRWDSAATMPGHKASDRQPSAAIGAPPCSCSASGLSMPAALNAAAPCASNAGSGPGDVSKTST